VGFQVQLDRQGFSPGQIDGKLGVNFSRALRAMQAARGLPSNDQPNCAAWEALASDGAGPTITTYTITAEDLKGPFVQIPRPPAQQARLPAAHVSWCADRYRSYNPDDNSYMSYSGQQRPCVSPYLDTTAAADRAAPAEVSYVEGAAPLVASADLSDDHVQSCFSRYRSYRPEDNSYQPYSGGPRRQCE